MENQYSDLFLMQHLASISHQKIYPNLQSKVEMPLWKTLQITRLWNKAREQEIYLLHQQQQQKSDWWFNQMTTTDDEDSYLSHQLLENYLPPSWFDDERTSIATAETDEDATYQHTTHSIALPTDDASDCKRDSDVATSPNTDVNTSDPTITSNNNNTTTNTTNTATDRASLLSHTPVESLWTQDDLVSLLAVTNQDRKRKLEEDPSTVCQGNPTSPPATRAPSSPPMLKV